MHHKVHLQALRKVLVQGPLSLQNYYSVETLR